MMITSIFYIQGRRGSVWWIIFLKLQKTIWATLTTSYLQNIKRTYPRTQGAVYNLKLLLYQAIHVYTTYTLGIYTQYVKCYYYSIYKTKASVGRFSLVVNDDDDDGAHNTQCFSICKHYNHSLREKPSKMWNFTKCHLNLEIYSKNKCRYHFIIIKINHGSTLLAKV